MRVSDIFQKVKAVFGPESTFFHGQREDEGQEYAPDPYYAPQAQAAPQPQAAYQQQYAYQQPQAAYPPQQTPWEQQNVQQPYVPPRNRRAQPAPQPQRAPYMPQESENVVPFPGAPSQPVQQPACTRCVNVRGIAECRVAISCLRGGDSVIVVMDSIADQGEMRRCADVLNGACFSLGGSLTRLSMRFCVYLMAPASMQVLTDQAITQANTQTRAPLRARAAAQGVDPYQPGYGPVRNPSAMAPDPQGFTPRPQSAQETDAPFYAQQPAQTQEIPAQSFTQQAVSYGYAPDAYEAQAQ